MSGKFSQPENYDKISDLPDGLELWAGANDWECGWTVGWTIKADDPDREIVDYIEVDHSDCPGCHGDPGEMHSKYEKECIAFGKDAVYAWAGIDPPSENRKDRIAEYIGYWIDEQLFLTGSEYRVFRGRTEMDWPGSPYATLQDAKRACELNTAGGVSTGNESSPGAGGYSRSTEVASKLLGLAMLGTYPTKGLVKSIFNKGIGT